MLFWPVFFYANKWSISLVYNQHIIFSDNLCLECQQNKQHVVLFVHVSNYIVSNKQVIRFRDISDMSVL